MGQRDLFVGANSEIRFFAPVSWRGRVRTSDVRRLLSQYRGIGLAIDPGPGRFQAKVLLNGDQVRRLADASGRDVSSFLRCLLAPRMPPAPARKPVAMLSRTAAAPSPRPVATRGEFVLRQQTNTQTPGALPRMDEHQIVAAFCSQCGGYRDGTMVGVPSRFHCLTCGGS
jgi:hypothetical protein